MPTGSRPGRDQTVSSAWTVRGASRSPAAEEPQLQQHREAGDRAAGPLDQVQRRRRGAAGGQHVVDHQHPLAGRERVLVHLQGGLAVLQRVRRRVAPPGAACRPCGPAPPLAGGVRDRGGDRNPRASMPATTSNEPRRGAPTIASIDLRGTPAPSANSGVRSLKTMPGLGKSGTSSDLARPPASAISAAAVARARRASSTRHRRLRAAGPVCHRRRAAPAARAQRRLPAGRLRRRPRRAAGACGVAPAERGDARPAGVGRPAAGLGRPRPPAPPAPALRRAAPRRGRSPRAPGQHPRGVRLDPRLLLLQRRPAAASRRRSTSRHADAHTDEQHQAEVLQRARAEQAGADEQQAADRQQRHQTGVDRPHQRLVDRQVGRLGVRLRAARR